MRPTVLEWMIVEMSSLGSFWKRFVAIPAGTAAPAQEEFCQSRANRHAAFDGSKSLGFLK